MINEKVSLELSDLIRMGEEVLNTQYKPQNVAGRCVDKTKFYEWQNQVLLFLKINFGEKSTEYLDFKEKCNSIWNNSTLQGLSLLKAMGSFLGKSEIKNYNGFWDIIHPTIREISEERFISGFYADSVEAALKEINNTIKEIVKLSTNQEYDGAPLMNKAFSLENPIIHLDDLSTDSGKNVQKGYMLIFSGSMTGIRNPKAHANINIDINRAMHLITLASLLMYKVDEAKK